MAASQRFAPAVAVHDFPPRDASHRAAVVAVVVVTNSPLPPSLAGDAGKSCQSPPRRPTTWRITPTRTTRSRLLDWQMTLGRWMTSLELTFGFGFRFRIG